MPVWVVARLDDHRPDTRRLQPDAHRQPTETRSDDDRAAHRARPGMAVIARPIGTGGLPVRMRIWSPMVERSAWNRPTIARALDRLAHTWKRPRRARPRRSEEHTSELQSLMRTSYAVFCLKKNIIDT